MRLASARAVASWSASAFAFASLTTGGEIPDWVAGLFGVAWVASLASGGRIGRGRGGLLTGLTGLVLLVLAALWLAGSVDLVVAASLFATALAANRLLARQSAADDGPLHLSALLMLAGGAALSADLLYGLCFAGFAVGMTAALALSHLSRSVEAAQAPEAAANRLISGRLLAALAGLSVAALAGSLVLFFVFPRFTAGIQVRGRGGGARAGFAGEVRLTGHGVIKGDATPALRVRLDPDPGAHRLETLWRGRVLDFFDGHGWRASAPRSPSVPVLRFPPGEGETEHRVEVLPSAGADVIFSSGRPSQIGPVTRVPPRSTRPPLFLSADALGNVSVTPTPEGSFSYGFRSGPVPAAGLAGLGADYPAHFADTYLQLPGRPRSAGACAGPAADRRADRSP